VRGAFNHWERVKKQIVELSAKKVENDDVPGDWGAYLRFALLPESTLLERKSAKETTSIEMTLQVQLPARVMSDTKQRQTAWQRVWLVGSPQTAVMNRC
jgi:hypothetical protein